MCMPASSTACRLKCVVCVPSCADAAALPVGICDTQSKNLQLIPDIIELVESSQGSPITYSPALMQLLHQTADPRELPVPDEACPSAATTPASTTVIRACFWFLNLDWDLQMASVCFLTVTLYSRWVGFFTEKYTQGARMCYSIR